MNTIVKEAVAIAGSQTKLAKRLGVCRSAVTHWIQNARQISPCYVMKMSAATNGKYLPHQIRPDLPEIFPHP